MSFEDDAYWESEYTDRSSTRYAVARASEPAASPVDELAVRRNRRQARYPRPPPVPLAGVRPCCSPASVARYSPPRA